MMFAIQFPQDQEPRARDKAQAGDRKSPAILSCIALLAALIVTFVYVRVSVAQDDEKGAESAKTVSRAEVKEKQLDVSLEARDIERILGKLKRASDLSKQRITEAAQKAESASGALDRGDSQAAQTEALEAAMMFQEIRKQLEALLANETPQRVAAAQNLAQQLSQAERQFLQQFRGALNPTATGGKGKVDPRSKSPPTDQKQKQSGEGGNQKNGTTKDDAGKKAAGGDPDDPKAKTGGDDKQQTDKEGAGKNDDPNAKKMKNGKGDKGDKKDSENGSGEGKEKERPGAGGAGEKQAEDDAQQGGSGDMSDEQRREAMARRAEQLAESGKTLDDILSAITQSTDPADADAVRMVDALLKETDLKQAIANMQQAANMIRAGELSDARLASQDIADRMEIAAQRLGSAYRLIVAPQAEELRKLEQVLADMVEKLQQLETPAQVAAWHREMRELLDELDRLGVSDEIREQLIEEMKNAGFDVTAPPGTVGWQMVNGLYVPPITYKAVLVQLQEDVQLRIQNLLIGDLNASPDDVTPPKYQELVERYYQILSRESSRKESSNRPIPAEGKK